MDDLAARAGERLTVAGSRASLRQDYRAAINLLERAADLLPEELRDRRFEGALYYARVLTGQGEEAVVALAEAAARFEATGDRITALALRLLRTLYRRGERELRELAEEALPVFEAAGDEWALAVAWGSLMLAEDIGGSRAAVAAAAEHAIEHGRAADAAGAIDWAEGMLIAAQYTGATPVEECLRWLDEHPDVERRRVLPYRPRLLAMIGRFDEAHRLLAEAADRVAGLGDVGFQIGLATARFDVAMLEGDVVAAEAASREACERKTASGELGNFMFFSDNLAQALLGLGRNDEAEQWLERRRERDTSEEAQIVWHRLRGKVLARRGELEEGERLAREAVGLAAETDLLNAHGDALLDLAEVLGLAGKDATPELEQALELYERKGNVVMAERTCARLA
jgi:tetratricopeptide (TPR) repeat protein